MDLSTGSQTAATEQQRPENVPPLAPDLDLAATDRDVGVTETEMVDGDEQRETDPARLLRASTALQQTLEELRTLDVDGEGAPLAALAYNNSLQEIRANVPVDLTGELDDVALPIGDDASFEEIRLGHARLVGWLQGMFQGMQASLMIEQAQRKRQQPTLDLPTGDRSNTYL